MYVLPSLSTMFQPHCEQVLSILRFVLLPAFCMGLAISERRVRILGEVISGHFMLKSEKPSSASGSERRLCGTHMFFLLCCFTVAGRRAHTWVGETENQQQEQEQKQKQHQQQPLLRGHELPTACIAKFYTSITDTLRRSVTWPESSHFN